MAGILPSSKAFAYVLNGLGAICLKGLKEVEEASALRFLVNNERDVCSLSANVEEKLLLYSH